MDLWNGKLSEVMEAHTAALVGSATGTILSRVGMAEIFERMRMYQVCSTNSADLLSAFPPFLPCCCCCS